NKLRQVELATGFEPAAACLQNRCSTVELRQQQKLLCLHKHSPNRVQRHDRTDAGLRMARKMGVSCTCSRVKSQEEGGRASCKFDPFFAGVRWMARGLHLGWVEGRGVVWSLGRGASAVTAACEPSRSVIKRFAPAKGRL